jgi:hypothetical protein
VAKTFPESPRLVVEKQEFLDIDIKPRSDPNSINLCSKGAVPIAIFGSGKLSVYDIDSLTLSFADAGVKMVGKKALRSLCSIENIKEDIYDDLVCHFVTFDAVALDSSSSVATVTGELFDSTPIKGTDIVNIIKDTCN